MEIPFYKYEGAGNDFILIDNRNLHFPKDNHLKIKQLCHRNFGIGADGLILLENNDTTNFTMVYYNANGEESTLCGNGGRCIVAFAKQLGLIDRETHFMAVDGIHHASIDNKGIISLHMLDVENVAVFDSHVFANTGSPHHVALVDDLDNYPVYQKGKEIRNKVYGKEGSNVNFVEFKDDTTLKVRTYERGVENETLACGTGVTAAAIAMHAIKKVATNKISVEVEGGLLSVSFNEHDGYYSKIVLTGPATLVFKGTISL